MYLFVVSSRTGSPSVSVHPTSLTPRPDETRGGGVCGQHLSVRDVPVYTESIGRTQNNVDSVKSEKTEKKYC